MRLWQYLAHNSLWLDEAALARNIIDRPVAALFEGLDYVQTAPVGFLLVEKALITLFGTSELVLRAFPLFCSLLALPLFWSLAKRVLSGWSATFAVGLFSLGIPFIYFASQVKQYSSDVFFAILVLYGAIEIRRRGVTPMRALRLGAAGAAAAWFSQPVVFVLAGTGLGLLIVVGLERDWRAARTFLVTWTLWGASAIGAAMFALHTVTPADQAYFRWFWDEGFMPWPPASVSDAFWVLKKITWAFGSFGEGMHRLTGGLNYRWSWLFTAVLLVGLVALLKRHRDAALFVILPLALAAGLSAAHVYPFTARLFAFLLPALLLATAAGVDWLVDVVPERFAFATPVILAVMGGAPLYAAATALPPSWLQPLRPIMEAIQARREPGDSIWVYYLGGHSFYYYANRLGVSLDRVIVGRCPYESRDMLREIDQFRGRRRVWVVFSHAQPSGAVPLDYLDRIGRRLEVLHRPGSGGQPLDAAYAALYEPQ